MGVDEKRSVLETEVLPRVFNALPSVFPEFGWVRRRGFGGGWVATNRAHTKGLFVARPNRVICNEHSGFYVFGQGSTHWLAYLNGGAFPCGDRWHRLVEELTSRCGSAPVASVPQGLPRQGPRAASVLRRLAAAAQLLLRKNPGSAWRYARSRAIGDDVIFGRELGFVPTVEEWFAAAGVARFDVHDIRGKLWSEALWANRLVAPWRTLSGEPVALWGRALEESDDDVSAVVGRDRPKYVVAGERPMLYGHDRALRSRCGDLVLIEGKMNLLELESAGVCQTASLGGDGVAHDLFEALAAHGVARVTVGFDGDDAGRSAALRLEARLAQQPTMLDVEVVTAMHGNPTADEVRSWIRGSA